MTNVIKDSLLRGMLERLGDNSSLELSLDHNANGYTLYLSEGTKHRECSCRVIEAMHQQKLLTVTGGGEEEMTEKDVCNCRSCG